MNTASGKLCDCINLLPLPNLPVSLSTSAVKIMALKTDLSQLVLDHLPQSYLCSKYLSHISLRREDNGLESVVGVADLLLLTDGQQALQHLAV